LLVPLHPHQCEKDVVALSRFIEVEAKKGYACITVEGEGTEDENHGKNPKVRRG
jgi:hypothetical protein